MKLKCLKCVPGRGFAGLKNVPNGGGVVGVVAQGLNGVDQRVDRAVAALASAELGDEGIEVAVAVVRHRFVHSTGLG